MKKPGKFFKWIDKNGGPLAVGRKLGMPRNTVYRWRMGQRTPLLPHAYKLIKTSRGAFNFTDILSDTTKGKMK